MSLRPLTMHTQRESCKDKIIRKRRTSQDKFSLPLLFLNTSAIHVVQKHKLQLSRTKNLTVGKMSTDWILPCGLKRGARDYSQERQKVWDASQITQISMKLLGYPCFQNTLQAVTEFPFLYLHATGLCTTKVPPILLKMGLSGQAQ